MPRLKYQAFTFLLGAILSGCSITKMAVNETASIMLEAIVVYERETDLELAAQAIPSNLKMIEALLEVTPDNPDLLFLACYSYTLYASGFVDEKIDIADKQYDFEKKDLLIIRANDYYERAIGFGLKLIAQTRKTFPEAFEQDLESLSSELKVFKKKHVPALFWTAYAWVSLINLQPNDPDKLAKLPNVELIMQRVMELDENYFCGGAHMFYGAYYGGRPKILGGDPVKAKQHLERAIEISRGKYLMPKFLLAKYYAVQAQDRECFEQTLREIISAPRDLFPEQSLANQLAKRNAERYLGYADELFF